MKKLIKLLYMYIKFKIETINCNHEPVILNSYVINQNTDQGIEILVDTEEKEIVCEYCLKSFLSVRGMVLANIKTFEELKYFQKKYWYNKNVRKYYTDESL